MSRLNKAVLTAQGFEAPKYNYTYRCLLAVLGDTGYAMCLFGYIDGAHNKQLRFLLVQQLWEGVPCLA